MDNMVKIAKGIYLVRTEAGFRKAIKSRFSRMFEDWKEIASDRMYGYPKSYPAIVSLSVGYNGDTIFQCNSVHVNTIKEIINNV